MKKKHKKNKDFNINQKSFYFEAYLDVNQKKQKVKNSKISQDRIYLLFFLFISLIVIFSIKIVFVSLKNPTIYSHQNNSSEFTSLRRDIVDRNGTLISRNITSFHAAIKPNLIKNKDNFLINIRLNFPELPIKSIAKKLDIFQY